MSAHVLLNLLNKQRKIKCEAYQACYCFFAMCQSFSKQHA